MRHLNANEVVRAVTMLQEGRTFHQVVHALDVSSSVIYWLWGRYRETGLYSRRAGQGRRRITIQQEGLYLALDALSHYTATARDLQNAHEGNWTSLLKLYETG